MRKNGQTTKEELFKRIDEFVKVRNESTRGGGYAEVDPKDVEELYGIFYNIVDLKYGEDADGDTPIDINILDRTRFEPRCGDLPVPYTHKAKTVEEYDEILDRAICNAGSAMDRVSRIMKIRWHEVRRLAEEAAKKAVPK